MNLLSEQQLVNLESLTAIYNSLKETNENRTYSPSAQLGFSNTITTTSQSVDEEKGFVSEIRDMILTRIATIVDDCGCDEDLEENNSEDDNVKVTLPTEDSLTTSEAKDYIKINPKANVIHTDWEEGEYMYWDPNLQEFCLENGEVFTEELNENYDESDKWVVL